MVDKYAQFVIAWNGMQTIHSIWNHEHNRPLPGSDTIMNYNGEQ